MSQPTATNPTQEQIRATRRDGFKNSVQILPENRRDALTSSYEKQDERRERNVSGFYSTVIGAK